MKWASLLPLVGIAVVGCTSKPRLLVEPTAGANIGDASVRVTGGETPVPDRTAGVPSLFITVTNRTKAEMPFGPGNVTIMAVGHAVRTYSREDMVLQILRQAKFLGDAAQTRAEMRAQILGQQPVASNPTAIELRTTGLQEAATTDWAARRALAALNDVLVSTALKPGDTLTCRVLMNAADLRNAGPVAVHIQLGNEDHAFTLQLTG